MTIDQFIEKNKLADYRLQQFNKAYYQQLIDSFDDLTTWSKQLRQSLNQNIKFSTLKKIKQLVSTDGHTIKVVFETQQGYQIEAVLMQYEDGRNSVCVSCMVGCPGGCRFCATAKMGFLGKLSAQEIVDQVLYFARLLKQKDKKITNVVFMGMGEPLLNLDAVWSAIKILTDPKKFALGKRRITISTAGYVRELKQLLELGFRGRLAISLHAAEQELREELMPVAKLYSLKELFKVIEDYIKLTNKRVTCEYILINNFNDSIKQAKKLAALLKDKLIHVNLIPYNPVAGESFETPSRNQIYRFANILRGQQIAHSIRITMGDDIKAACGQLATKVK